MTTPTVSSRQRGFRGAARWSLVMACWLYAAGVMAQLFAVGMVFLAGQGTWLETHRALGHGLGLFAIVAPLAALLGRLPRPLLALSFGLFVLHGLQYAFGDRRDGPAAGLRSAWAYARYTKAAAWWLVPLLVWMPLTLALKVWLWTVG